MLSAQPLFATMQLLGVLAAVLPAVLGTAVSSLDVTAGLPRDSTTSHIEFKSSILNDTALRFIRNSGVCETTPGVNQLSGYVDVGTNMSMVSELISKLHFPFIDTGLVVLVLRSPEQPRDCAVHPMAERRTGMLVYDWTVPRCVLVG